MNNNDFSNVEGKINSEFEYDTSSYLNYEYPENLDQIKEDGILKKILALFRTK